MKVIDADTLMEQIARMVENAPSIEQKRSRWSMEWNSFFKVDMPMCIECKAYYPFKTNFCPHCGAYMRQVDEESHDL